VESYCWAIIWLGHLGGWPGQWRIQETVAVCVHILWHQSMIPAQLVEESINIALLLVQLLLLEPHGEYYGDRILLQAQISQRSYK